jgi:hypothetical protein
MHMLRLRPVPAGICLSLLLILGGLTFACAPAAAPAPATPVAEDPFAVVRATSQAAYQAGKTYLDQGDIVRGCPAIDTAKTNDPDNNPDIQRALDQCLAAIASAVTDTPTAVPTASQRPIVVATVPAVVGTPVAPAATAGGAQPASPLAGTSTQPSGSGQAASLVAWHDPQGRFTIGAPSAWEMVDQPQPLFGTGVVEFRDPTGRAEIDVAVADSKAVSPELYAASMEIAMQQPMPGYASEQVQPSSTAGQPSIRRVFTFMQRDSAGHDLTARAVQVAVLKGSTPYILSGSAPAEQFEQYSGTFDQMVDSFRFC